MTATAAVASRSGQAQLQPFEAVEPHMGTLFRIKLYAPNASEAKAAFQAAFNRIGQLDDILSDYKPDSELSLLSTRAVGHPQPVSEELFRVATEAQEVAAKTGGAFDITLGPVIQLWREARKRGVVPDASALADARAHSGYRLLTTVPPRSIQLAKTGMKLDVGGIAKGYAADEALKMLNGRGIKSALVAASGDLALSDAPPGQPGWKVGVDSFDSANAPFTRVLTLSNAAVSTSGDTEQHLDANGKRYSHVIDPKTGMGLTGPVTVTIVARRGIVADSLATAVSVLGPMRGLEFVNRQPGIAALIVVRQRNTPQVLESREFSRITGVSQ